MRFNFSCFSNLSCHLVDDTRTVIPSPQVNYAQYQTLWLCQKSLWGPQLVSTAGNTPLTRGLVLPSFIALYCVLYSDLASECDPFSSRSRSLSAASFYSRVLFPDMALCQYLKAWVQAKNSWGCCPSSPRMPIFEALFGSHSKCLQNFNQGDSTRLFIDGGGL